MSKFIFLGTGGLLSSICLKELATNKLFPTHVFIQDNPGSAYPNLTELICRESKIPFTLVDSINSENQVKSIKAINPDYGIIASFGQILKPQVLGLLPFFNVHMGILPDYRGAFTNFWKILHDHDEYGVTIHRITEKIDEGPIYIQKEQDFSTKIFANDFFRANYQMAAEVLVAFIKSDPGNEPPELIQPTHEGKYYRKHTAEDMILDGNEDALKLHKKINRLQFYGNPKIENHLISESNLLLHYSCPEQGYSLTSAGNGKLILKNNTGVLLLKSVSH